jgi:hypothetical protein
MTTPHAPRLWISTIHALRAPPRDWRGTVDDLEALLRRHGQTVEGKEGPAIVVSGFVAGEGQTPGTKGKRGRFRQEHLVAETWLLGLDFDSRPGDWRAIVAPLLGFDGIAYATHSHTRPGKGEAPRFRLLVPYSRSVTPAEHRALVAWAAAYCGGGNDESCSDPTRLFYTPRRQAHDATEAPWIERFHGPRLDPDNLPDGQTVAGLLAAAAHRKPTAPPDAVELKGADRVRTAATVAAPGAGRWARAALERECDAVASMAEGGRNNRLNASAFALGQLVAGGYLSADTVTGALLAAAHRCGLTTQEAQQTIDSGLSAGIDSGPRHPEASATARAKRSLTVLQDDAVPMPLEDARTRLLEKVAEALHRHGRVAIAADPGVGKTTALREQLPNLYLAGKTVRWALPTNDLAEEIEREARRVMSDAEAMSDAMLGAALAGIRQALKRTEDNCLSFKAVNAARRAGGDDGVQATCRACPHHPNNAEGAAGLCGFFVAKRAESEAPRPWLVFTTHELEAKRQAAAAATALHLQAFQRAAAAKAEGPPRRYRPGAQWGDDGLYLLPVADDAGSPPPELEGPPKEREAACLEWLATIDGLECAPTLEALRNKLAPTADQTDLVVIDERPKAADEAVAITADDLVAWMEAGDLEADDANKLLALSAAVRASENDKRARLTSADLAARWPHGTLRVRRTADGDVASEVAEQHLADHAAAAVKGDAERLQALEGAPPVAGLQALELATAYGWQGCAVASGKLHMKILRPIVGDDARTVVYLDGTATEATARALLGPCARFERIAVELHPDSTVTVVQANSAKSTLPTLADTGANDDDGAAEASATSSTRDRVGEARRRREAAVAGIRAVAERHGGKDALAIVHKGWTEDKEVGPLLEKAFGKVTWFGAADATGSNDYKDCPRAVVWADYYLPQYEKRGLAEAFALRAADDPACTLELEEWEAQAQHQTEAATVLQALHRVRPIEQARHLVLVTRRELPTVLEARVSERVPIDRLVFEVLGITPPGRAGAALLLRREVLERGPVALGCGVKPTPRAPENTIWRTRCCPDTALQRGSELWADHGGFPAMAEAAGVAWGHAPTSDGSRAPMAWPLTAPRPDAATVARLVSKVRPGLRWVEWDGQRVELERDDGAMLEALRSLPFDGVGWEALAEAAGVSESTCRRRLRALGIASLEALREAWRGLTMPPPLLLPEALALEVAPDAHPTWALRGGSAWLLLAPPEAVAWWLRHRPPNATAQRAA